jgi:hypothetical protein
VAATVPKAENPNQILIEPNITNHIFNSVAADSVIRGIKFESQSTATLAILSMIDLEQATSEKSTAKGSFVESIPTI